MVDAPRGDGPRRFRWTLSTWMIVIAVVAFLIAVIRPIDPPARRGSATPRARPQLEKVFDSGPLPAPSRPAPVLTW